MGVVDRLEIRAPDREAANERRPRNRSNNTDCHNAQNHQIHTEYFQVSSETADALNRARQDRRRIVAVGTTSVRVLEQLGRNMAQSGQTEVTPTTGQASIFILPGHEFRLVDVMITNFHLPRSTLLMLVSAFAGRENILAAYREAIDRRYRFFSFGDAMMIG